MGNKRNKCCCDTPPPPWPEECPTDYYCIETGLSNNECGEDVPPFIGIGGFDCTEKPLCCNFPTYLELNPFTCTWNGEDGPCGTWTLTQSGTLTLTMADATVYTWLPVDGFSPLCTGLFEYVGDHEAAPCGICRFICSAPASACCDNVDGRTDPMPGTLHATAVYCCGLESDLILEFPIVWDSSIGRWVGEAAACNGNIMHLEMWCNGGIENGCGDPGVGYQAEVTYTSLFEHVSGWSSCGCNPFEAEFGFPVPGGCAAEAESGLAITVTE